MSSLTLQYGHDILEQYDLGDSLTIGRLPDNAVVIDNPAVSGHHARVVRDGSEFSVEDLGSTNGTFVNDKRVLRHQLKDGDVVVVGKHKLVFSPNSAGESVLPAAAGPVLTNLDDTVYLDTKRHKNLLAKAVPVAAPGVTVGVLSVRSGRAEHPEYRLDRHTSVIGRSDRAMVRLRGWWKPQVALVITRTEDSYVVTRLSGKPRINNELLTGRHALRHGDVLSVSGLVLEFTMRPLVRQPLRVPQTA
jgi:pSer/pThr/pTyr-binding forkhead associated (FHA) protein